MASRQRSVATNASKLHKLKRQNVAAELHIYVKGGHDYGMRPIKGAVANTWPQRATQWLRVGGLVAQESGK